MTSLTESASAPEHVASSFRRPAVADARGRGPLPLVVGVTGHRDLRSADVPILEELVWTTLVEVQKKYPHSPLLLLSPLAEGSDRLVARVAHQLGARLIVPLPMPQDLYEDDFEGEESRAEFRRLLASAEGTFELPVVKGNTAVGISEPGEQRNRQYAQVGAFIARYSQVFLALWDGASDTADDKVGGTAEVVRFRLEGVPAQYDSATSPLSFASGEPVYHIMTPRAAGPVSEHAALTRRVLFPTRQTARSFDQLQDWMDQFNADALEHGEKLASAQIASKAQLLQVPVTGLADGERSLPSSARVTLEHYAVADSLALRFGAQARAASRQLYGLVFMAALFFNLFHSLPNPHVSEDPTLAERLLGMPWLLLLFLALSLVGSLWVHRSAEEADYQNKHQDYRALAEALRIQFFWQIAGVPEAVVDHYLRKQRGALEWIRNALRVWDVELLARQASDGEAWTPATRLAFVRQRWVTEQRNYYVTRARREQATLESEGRKIRVLVRLSIALAFLFALALTIPLLMPWSALEAIKRAAEDPWVHGIIMVSIVTLAVTAGLRHGYNQQMARSEHAKQFGRMSKLFDSAEQHLAAIHRAGDHRRATELLKDLGEEALEENGDWVLLHRERPLEVPHSG